jgi:hypothetical protein
MNKVLSTLLRFTITSGALAGAAAHAADPADHGVMTFPNARVVSAPAADTTKAAKPRAANAQIAVVDSATGQLRAPTADEMTALLANATPLGGTSTTTTTTATGELAGTPVVNASGVTGYMLDESTASYAVAKKDADGSVEHVCVDDEHSAKSTLAAPAAKQGVKHDR